MKFSKIIIIFTCALLFISNISFSHAASNEDVYAEKSAALKTDDVNGHYQLGLWCLKNNLSEQAKQEFDRVLELNPNHAEARDKLGHIKYKDKWLSQEEAKGEGLVQYKGKWMPLEESMKAQGKVNFEGEWITKKEQDLILKLAKLYPWKGVLDTPGADSENLPWKNARKKDTDHFIVKTNLSEDALNDICFLLEYAYFVRQDLIAFPESKEKLKVSVPKNREEFEKIHGDILNNPKPAYDGCLIPKEDSANKFREDHLLVHYYPDGKFGVSVDILHEGTHGALRLLARSSKVLSCVNPPLWLDEGLATYFESGKIKGKMFSANIINAEKLPAIKTMMEKGSYMKLREFINIPQSSFTTGYQYAQAWSLVYFLLNARDGKYKQGFRTYIDKWKAKKIEVKSDASGVSVVNKDEHIKIFEQAFGLTTDQMEGEWKEYTLFLK